MENRDYYQYLRSKNFGESKMEGANRKRALPIHNQPAAKRPVPLPSSPPTVHPLQNPTLLTQLLAYCTPAQRLLLTQFASPQFQQASLHPTAWHKVTCVRMCSMNTHLFERVPPRALLQINMANLVPHNEQLHDVKCARLRDLLIQMKNIRCLMFDGTAPFSVVHPLFLLLPKLKHLKHLGLVFRDNSYYAGILQTLLRDVLPLCDRPERLHLHIGMPFTSERGLKKHTIELAARLHCTIDTLLRLGPEEIGSSAEVMALVDAFAGVRSSQLTIHPDLVQARDTNEQMLAVGIVNKLAPGSLKAIFWMSPSALPATATGSIREALDGMHNTQLSQVTQFISASKSSHGLPADIGYYNSCTRLTTTMTEFLVKMPKLKSLFFCPCHALARPFVFETQPFMLMVQCFMQRALENKERLFEVTLTNVLDMSGVDVDNELKAAYPLKHYGLIIKHHERESDASFSLEIIHWATERTLELCIETLAVLTDEDEDDDEDEEDDSD